MPQALIHKGVYKRDFLLFGASQLFDVSDGGVRVNGRDPLHQNIYVYLIFGIMYDDVHIRSPPHLCYKAYA